jgi:nicotinate-nucleotide adenylyltransferase
MHIGLYFGTFNPIHHAHLAVAEGMYRRVVFDAVWFVVSPNSPFKVYSQLLDEIKRLELVNVAIENMPYCLALDVEFQMERPSYTYLTLRKLKQLYPEHTFSIIMGEDNLIAIQQWKNHEEILRNHAIYVYPRDGVKQKKDLSNVFYIDLPLLNISSSQIRERLRNGESIENLVPKDVIEIIEREELYKSK